MLSNVQILVLELGSECNYAKEHPACPVSIRPKGDKALTDEKVIELVDDAYNKLGFTGYVAWHYYNEPMLYWKRMLKLMEKVKEKVPQVRFLLWTNGSILIDDPRFDMFERVQVTDYQLRGHKHYQKYYRNTLHVNREMFDNRLEYEGPNSDTPCFRPFTEFVVTHFGEVHLCCQDWENRVKIGNVFDKSLTELVEAREKLVLTICRKMDDTTPEVCRKCNGKFGFNEFDDDIKNRTLIYLAKMNFKR